MRHIVHVTSTDIAKLRRLAPGQKMTVEEAVMKKVQEYCAHWGLDPSTFGAIKRNASGVFMCAVQDAGPSEVKVPPPTLASGGSGELREPEKAAPKAAKKKTKKKRSKKSVLDRFRSVESDEPSSVYAAVDDED
jgi:hypothetical protein